MRSFSILIITLIIDVLVIGHAGASGSTGSTTFLVTGTVTNVSALEIFIDYDTATLANPRANGGSVTAGGLFVANPNIAGRIHIAFIAEPPITGSGTLATITFDTTGPGGKILAVSSVAVDSARNKIAIGNFAVTQLESSATGTGKGLDTPPTLEMPPIFNAGSPTSTTPTEGLAQPYRGTPGRGAGVESSREVSDRNPAPGPAEQEQVQEQERKSAESAHHNAVDEGDSPPAGSAAETTWKPPLMESALHRFSRIQGEMTPKTLQTLLLAGSQKDTRQDPTVVLSDGKSIVRVTVDLPPSRRTPQFMLNDAKVLYMGREDERTWVLDILPNTNVAAASVLVVVGGGTLEIPLTVAPPADVVLTQGQALNETAFARFLKERGTTGAPSGDLNHDGRRDYIDDYIYTCNYFFMKNTSPE